MSRYIYLTAGNSKLITLDEDATINIDASEVVGSITVTESNGKVNYIPINKAPYKAQLGKWLGVTTILIKADSLSGSIGYEVENTINDLVASYATDASGNVIGLNGLNVNLGVGSSNVLFCIGGRDTLTSFTDGSGKGATATVDAGNSAPFGNVGYMSTVAALNGGITVPQNKILWNPSSESIILGFMLNKAVPAGSEAIIGFGGGVAASQLGFYLSHRVTTGAIKIVPTISGALINAQADSTAVWDGSADQHCAVAYDATTGVFSIYKNGILSNSFTGTPMIGANAYPNSISAHEYRIGAPTGGTSVTSVVTKSYGHQAYKFFGGLPNNVGQIAQRLAESPRLPIVSV